MSWRRLFPLLLWLLILGPAAARGEDESPGLVFQGLERGTDGVWTHEFGEAAQQQELEATLTYRNGGSQAVTGIRAVGDCGCYGVTLSSTRLAPGQQGTLTVRFRTLMFSGVVTKRLRLHSDGGPKHGLVLKLRVDVVAGVVIEPPRIWFGDVLVGSLPQQTVVAKWHEGSGRPFKVLEIDVPGHDFDIRTQPYREGKWTGTAVTLAFKTPPPLGMFTGNAMLRTDHPDYPVITLALTANVTGKVWVQTRKVYLGWVPRGQTKRTTVLVRPLDAGTDLGDVTAKCRGGRVDVRVEKRPRDPAGWWRLIIEVPKDAAPGRLDDTIEVRTKVPGEEVTEVRVRGEVLAGGV